MRLLVTIFPKPEHQIEVGEKGLPGSCQQMWRLRIGQETATANHITEAIYSFLPHCSISMPRQGAQIALQLEAEIVSARGGLFLWIQSSSIVADLLGDRLKCFASSKAAGRFKMLLFQLFWLQALWDKSSVLRLLVVNGVKVLQGEFGMKRVESKWSRTKRREAFPPEKLSSTRLTAAIDIYLFFFSSIFFKWVITSKLQAWWQWWNSHCCLWVGCSVSWHLNRGDSFVKKLSFVFLFFLLASANLSGLCNFLSNAMHMHIDDFSWQ